MKKLQPKKSFFFLFVIVSLFVQCKNEWHDIQILQQKVEAVHDEPMAKMDRLEAFQKRAAAEMAATDSTDLSKKMRRDSLGKFVIRCQRANDAMFDWMAQYRAPDPKTDDPKAARAYLESQLLMAEKMREQVLSAIETGEKSLRPKKAKPIKKCGND